MMRVDDVAGNVCLSLVRHIIGYHLIQEMRDEKSG
jgi:hypothetical protein